jgi:hypothetical protein
MSFSLTFRGTDAFARKVEQATEELKRRAAKALVREAEAVMADSKENYVPVDTGNLRNTGVVLPAVIDASGVSVEMGFSADYAAVVHEDLTAQHPNGEAKYLTKPLTKRAAGMNVRIANAMLRG